MNKIKNPWNHKKFKNFQEFDGIIRKHNLTTKSISGSEHQSPSSQLDKTGPHQPDEKWKLEMYQGPLATAIPLQNCINQLQSNATDECDTDETKQPSDPRPGESIAIGINFQRKPQIRFVSFSTVVSVDVVWPRNRPLHTGRICGRARRGLQRIPSHTHEHRAKETARNNLICYELSSSRAFGFVELLLQQQHSRKRIRAIHLSRNSLSSRSISEGGILWLSHNLCTHVA